MKSSSVARLAVFVFLMLLSSSASRFNKAPPRSEKNARSNFRSKSQSSVSTKKASRMGSQVGCFPDKNDFLTSLAEKNVRLLSQPQKVEKCGKEWSRFGSCCDTQSLESYVREMNGRTDAAKKSFFDDVVALSRDIEGQTEVLNKHVSELLLPDDELVATVGNVVSSISKSKGSLDDLLESFQTNQDQCLAKQLEFRAGSLCGVCSGRSLAFISGGKAIISLEACQATIETCDNYWRQLIEFVDTIDSVEAELLKVKELSGVNGDIFKSGKHKELLYFIRRAKLRSFLKSCSVAKNCNKTTATSICGLLMTIKKSDPLTRRSIESLEKTQKSMNSMLSSMSHKLERERSAKGHSGPGLRPDRRAGSSSEPARARRSFTSEESPLRKLYLSSGFSYSEVTVWSSRYGTSSFYSTRPSSTHMSFFWRFP